MTATSAPRVAGTASPRALSGGGSGGGGVGGGGGDGPRLMVAPSPQLERRFSSAGLSSGSCRALPHSELALPASDPPPPRGGAVAHVRMQVPPPAVGPDRLASEYGCVASTPLSPATPLRPPVPAAVRLAVCSDSLSHRSMGQAAGTVAGSPRWCFGMPAIIRADEANRAAETIPSQGGMKRDLAISCRSS